MAGRPWRLHSPFWVPHSRKGTNRCDWLSALLSYIIIVEKSKERSFESGFIKAEISFVVECAVRSSSFDFDGVINFQFLFEDIGIDE